MGETCNVGGTCGAPKKDEHKQENNQHDDLIGNITCPKCGHVQKHKMPTASCQAFYKCDGCNEIIKATKSCCVFCDYGDRKCPVAAAHDK